MKLHFLFLFLGTLSTSLALAQQGTTSASATDTNRAGGDLVASPAAKPADSAPATSVARDPGVQEVLNMLHAGVSKGVIQVFIESSPKAYHLVGADLIALKKAGVPDELTTAMLKRGAELRLQLTARPSGPLPAGPPRRGGRLDPESYDFWWYHYAYPRALAYANERMLSPLLPFRDSYSYSYPDLPFRPQPLPRFSLGQ